MRGAGALTCFLALTVLMFIVHVAHTLSLPGHSHSKAALFYSFPLKGSISLLGLPVLLLQQLLSASCSGTAACMELCCPCCTRSCDYTEGWPLKQCTLRSLSPRQMNYSNYTTIVGFPSILCIFALI